MSSIKYWNEKSVKICNRAPLRRRGKKKSYRRPINFYGNLRTLKKYKNTNLYNLTAKKGDDHG